MASIKMIGSKTGQKLVLFTTLTMAVIGLIELNSVTCVKHQYLPTTTTFKQRTNPQQEKTTKTTTMTIFRSEFISSYDNSTYSPICLYGPIESVRANARKPNQIFLKENVIEKKLKNDLDVATNTHVYRYTKTRFDPGHLRVSELYKLLTYPSSSTIKLPAVVVKDNNDKPRYYENRQLSHRITFDELVFQAIDKISRHRLSAFYHYAFDNPRDRERASDPALVSQPKCRSHLKYLVKQLAQIRSSNIAGNSLSISSSNSNYKVINSTDNSQVDPNQDEVSIESSRFSGQQITPEIAAWFDSYAKQEAGILTGNVYWVGHYDQCINRHVINVKTNDDHNENNVDEMRGRYCVAALGARSWPQMLKEQMTRRNFKSDKERRNYQRLFRVQVGICLPQSCDSTTISLDDEVRSTLRELATSGLDAPLKNYELLDLYCMPDDNSELRAFSRSTKIFFAVCSLWLMAIIAATCYDHWCLCPETKSEPDNGEKKPKLSNWHKLARVMSLKANWHKFMKCDESSVDESSQEANKDNSKLEEMKSKETENSIKKTTEQSEEIQEDETKTAVHQQQQEQQQQQQQRVDLGFMNAIKALAMIWIINGHVMLLMIQTARNILDSDSLLNVLMHFLIGGTFGVDLFFTISGFLASYVLFTRRMAHKMSASIWSYLFFHRYWRLAPMYLLTFWFVSSVAHQLGSGPLWDYGTSSITFRGMCITESWTVAATLTSNLRGIYDECMITSWYISCDMQFWLMSPIFIFFLARSPVLGWAVTGAAIALSSALRFNEVSSDSLLSTVDNDSFHLELVKPRADIFMRVGYDMPLIYTRPQYRVSTYLVGLLAGHYVAMVATGRVSVTPMNAFSTKLGNSARWRPLLAWLGLFLVTCMALITWISHHYYPRSWEPHARAIASILYSVDHLMMGIGTSLILVTMALGQWRRVAKAMASPFWQRLSRLNYALLLIQCEAIYLYIFRHSTVPLAGTGQLVNTTFFLVFTLYPMALLVTLVFEYPLAGLEKQFIGVRK